MKALLDKGLLKVQNFQSSKHKLGYAYLLTPTGIAAKTALTARFLQRKMQEYALLQAEIESLKQEQKRAPTPLRPTDNVQVNALRETEGV